MTTPPAHDVAWSVPEHQRPGGELLVPFSVADGLVLVVWSLVGQLLAVVVLATALRAAGVDVAALSGPSLGAVSIVGQSVVMGGAFAWLAGRGRWTWRLWGARRPAPSDLLRGLLGGGLAFAASFTVILVGDLLVGPLEDPGQALLEEEMLRGTALVLSLVVAGLLAPLLEEIVFRGVLFQALGRRVGWVGGLVGSSVVFAVVHVEVIGFDAEGLVFGVALAVVGGVFAWLFHRTRSLVVPIVAHAVFNSGQLLLAAADLLD